MPNTKTRQVVTQMELHRIVRLTEEIDDLKAKLAELEAERGGIQEEVIGMIDEGIPVQLGRFGAQIGETKGRRCPKWKELHEEVVGAAEIKRIIETTEPGKGKRFLMVEAARVTVRKDKPTRTKLTVVAAA